MLEPQSQLDQNDAPQSPPLYLFDSDPPPAYDNLEAPPPYSEQRVPTPPLPDPLSHTEVVLALFLGDAEPRQPMALRLTATTQVKDIHLRHLFIRKVYLILFAQFVLISCIAAALLANKRVERWISARGAQFLVSSVLVYVFALVASTSLRLYTVSGSSIFLQILGIIFLTAVFACIFQEWPLLIGPGVISCSFLVVLLLSFQNIYDLTQPCGIFLIIASSIAVFGSFVVCISLAWPSYSMLKVLFAGIPAILYVAWLAVDTRMLWSNEEDAYTDKLRTDEYICAAMDLLTFLRIIRRIVRKDCMNE